jgi:phospholipid-translocating ATPase
MIWGSLLWYFVLDYFYNYIIGGPYVGSLTQAMKEATFWFTTVLTVIVLMVPVLASRFYFFDVFPSLSDKIRLKQREDKMRHRKTDVVLRTPSTRRARRSLRSGYAFAHQVNYFYWILLCSGILVFECVLRIHGIFLSKPLSWLIPTKEYNIFNMNTNY